MLNSHRAPNRGETQIKRLWFLSVWFAITSLTFTAVASRELSRDHIPEIVNRLVPFGHPPATQQLRLAIGLPLRNPQALSDLLKNIYDTNSPVYHEYLTPEQLVEQFGPAGEDLQSVTNFALAHHFTIVAIHPNRLVVDVIASVADVEQAFSIQMNLYHHPTEKRDFYATETVPIVADNVAILDISGLSDYGKPKPHSRKMPFVAKTSNATPHSGSAANGAYIGKDFRAAYLPGVTLTGTGQSVGLVQFDGFYASDISNYEAQAGLPNVTLQTVLLDGYSGIPTTNGNGEVSLDIEMCVSMAPGLASIILYEGGPDGMPNDVLSRMQSDNSARQLSCSWGWQGGPSGTTDNIFQLMAAQGQSFFCASGDDDAYVTGAIDNSSYTNTPCDSAYITVVGGTTLSTSGPGGTWTGETVWNWGGGTGSGGGISSYYAIPAWQQGVSMAANGGSTVYRNIPDVALTGDNVYVIYQMGTTDVFGGTSCATPLWGAFMALVNQQNAANGSSPIGFANPTIYAVAQGADYNADFHDITTGNNTSSISSSEFYAVTGYDLCTGWGTPSGQGLINDLAPAPDALAVSPGTTIAANGAVGGPFSVTSQNFALSNRSSTVINYAVGKNASWLSLSNSQGTLAPSTAGVTVVASLNGGAINLPAGTNVAIISFTNLSSGYVKTVQFILTISSQLVQNSGFETGTFSGWTQSGNVNYSFVTNSTSYVHSGTYGAKMGPSQTLGYLSQTLATVPGQIYFLSFWVDYPRAGTPNEFKASWNGGTLVDVTNQPATVWTNLQYFVLATNTNTTLQFGFRSDPQYVGFDDVSVIPVTHPTLAIQHSSNQMVQLSWNSIAGLIYQAQYKTNIQGSWINLGATVTASNSTTFLMDTVGVAQRKFYRLQVVP